jgi:hypothetical protein
MIRYGGVVLMMLWCGAAHAQLSAVESEATHECPNDICRALIICSHHQMPSYAARPRNEADFEPGFGKCAAFINDFEARPWLSLLGVSILVIAGITSLYYQIRATIRRWRHPNS